MYKLYIKENATYSNPEIYPSLDEAKNHARGEYLIIHRHDNTDDVIEHGEKEKRKGKRDYCR